MKQDKIRTDITQIYYDKFGQTIIVEPYKERKKSMRIPIFIISCNRLEVLKKSIQSYYDYIKTPFEIVIIDLGSTYKPTIKFLKNLEREKVKVYWKEKINRTVELNRVDWVVQDYFESHSRSNYIVTDSDIALDNVEGNILTVYSYLLMRLSRIDVVGSMLRIDDIPDYYRNKERVIARYRETFETKNINTIQYEGKIVRYVIANIDSTFGMSRAGTHWRRMKSGIRVLYPYSAKHLDWYLDLENPTLDHKYYMEHASREIAHWSIWGGDR